MTPKTMSKTIIITILLAIIPLSLTTITASVVDFCVANLQLPKTPSGYPCKNSSELTVDDFVLSDLGIPGNTSTNIFKVAVTGASDETFPALNGLGLSMFRLDIGVSGVVPIHSHRVSELILVIEGTIIAGFIGSDNTAYFKTLKKGDIMIFPHTLLHFQVNVGSTPALAFVSLNSAQPGFQFTTASLAGNDLPSHVVSKISLLDIDQVKKLKTLLGGTN